MTLRRKASRKAWKRTTIIRKLLATAERARRMLRTVDLPPGVLRDIETVERAARIAEAYRVECGTYADAIAQVIREG